MGGAIPEGVERAWGLKEELGVQLWFRLKVQLAMGNVGLLIGWDYRLWSVRFPVSRLHPMVKQHRDVFTFVIST